MTPEPEAVMSDELRDRSDCEARAIQAYRLSSRMTDAAQRVAEGWERDALRSPRQSRRAAPDEVRALRAELTYLLSDVGKLADMVAENAATAEGQRLLIKDLRDEMRGTDQSDGPADIEEIRFRGRTYLVSAVDEYQDGMVVTLRYERVERR